MTPQRWQRVNEILEQAWERNPCERAEFLNQACAHDPELRSQVEALLSSDENIGEFLAVPAMDVASSDVAEDSGESLSSRRIGPYQILREIGHGGMGTVYLAERADGQYHKQVAIKLVSAHLGTEEILQRFRNERQVAAALDHPNIARLLDGGATDDGRPYLVLEYVEGVRIDTWCNGRKLAVRDRLKLFQQVCAAVQHAHEQGVIHRDIKPGNILVTADGTPKLLDFGIAKVLNPKISGPAETTIGPGPMTPEYASPEQVRGERVSPASDIYALGVVLYHLLTGQLPYSVQGNDVRRIARMICEQEPVKPSVAILGTPQTVSGARGESRTSLRRQLTGDLDRIVLKALRKEPDRRYSSAAQFSEDLDRFLRDLPVHARNENLLYRLGKFLKRNRAASLAVATTAVLVLALVAGLGRFTRPNAGTDTGVRSIAVLPLENLSGNREQEYFADGITDALIGELARIRALRVISRTSVMSYKGSRRRLPEIARSLGVGTIAEGSVFRAGNRIRIAMRLVDAPKDRPIWSGSYEGELQDVLALQSRVAGVIAGEIGATLAAPDQAKISHRRVNLDAYDAYLKGRHQYLAEFTQESTEKAISYFNRAIGLDPRYAPAYAGLASCYYLLSNIYYRPTEMMPKAKAAALKAIELDDTLGEAHAILALVKSVYEFDRAGADQGFKRAIEEKPSDAEAHLWYGIHLGTMSRFDESLAEVEQAQKLDPVSPGMNVYIGFAFFLAHRYDQAIQRLQPIADMYPNYHHPHAILALAYEQKRDWAKATAEMERAYQLDQEPEALAQLGHVYAASGRRADARKVLKQLHALSRQRYVSAYSIALVHVGLGEPDEAFRWLQKAEEDRSEWFAQINVDPRLDGLHSDPRYAGVLRSVGLGR